MTEIPIHGYGCSINVANPEERSDKILFTLTRGGTGTHLYLTLKEVQQVRLALGEALLELGGKPEPGLEPSWEEELT